MDWQNNSFMEDKSKKCSTRNNHANVDALLYAAESESGSIRILEIKDIRNVELKKNANAKTLSQKPSYL